MADSLALNVVIKGDGSGLVGEMRRVTKEFNRSADGAKRLAESLKRTGEQLGQIGRSMTTKLTLPIAAAFGGILKVAGDFESGMNQVAAISGATGDQLIALSDQAKLLGRTTQFSASQAAEAMGFLAMAGNDVNQILKAMPGTLQLASAAQIDLGTAADTVTNIMAGYKLGAEELSRANDVLVTAFTSANTDLLQLAQAMKYAGPVASAAGVEFEEAAAAISLMGNAGIQGTMAGTSLRGAITRILSPTKEAKKVMSELGLQLTDTSGRLLPLDEIIQQLAPHAENTAAMMELFGQRAGPGMLSLVSQGTGAISELVEKMKESGGIAERISETQMKGFNGMLKELRSAAEGATIAIAESGLLEAATEMGKSFAAWMRELTTLNPEILKWGTLIAGGTAVLGPFLIALGFAATGIAALLSPIGLVIAGLAALTAAWVAWGDETIALINRVLDPWRRLTTEAIEYTANMVNQVKFLVADMVNTVDEWFGGRLSAAVEKVKAATASVAGFFGDLWEQVTGGDSDRNPFDSGIISDAALGKFISGLEIGKEAADEFAASSNDAADAASNVGSGAGQAAISLDDFIKKMREEAEVAQMSAEAKAVYDAIQDAMNAGITEGIDVIATEARELHRSVEAWKARQAAQKEAAQTQAQIIEELKRYFEQEERLSNEAEARRTSRLQSDVNRLAESLRTEEEAIHASYQERLAILDQAEAEGLTIIGGYEQAKLRLREEYNQQLLELENQTTSEMQKIWDNALENMQREFGDLIYNALWEDGIDSFGDFADAILDIWKRMIAEMVSAWITSKIAGWFGLDGGGGFNLGNFFGGGSGNSSSGGGFNISTITNLIGKGKGGGNGGVSTTVGGIAKLMGGGNSANVGVAARYIGGKIAAGFGAKMVAGQAVHASAIGDMFANATFNSLASGSAASTAGASAASGTSAASGAAAAGWAAVPLAIFALGSSHTSRRRARQERRENELYQQRFNRGDLEGAGGEIAQGFGTWKGSVDGVNGALDEMYLNMDRNLIPALEALVEQGDMALGSLRGAEFDETGQRLLKISGNAEAVKTALEGTTLAGFEFQKSLEMYQEKGSRIFVDLAGNTQQWKSALNAAQDAGVGSFRVVQEKSGELRAQLIGDASTWNEYLKGAVAQSIASASNNMDVLGSAGEKAAGKITYHAGQSKAVLDALGVTGKAAMERLKSGAQTAAGGVDMISQASGAAKASVTTMGGAAQTAINQMYAGTIEVGSAFDTVSGSSESTLKGIYANARTAAVGVDMIAQALNSIPTSITTVHNVRTNHSGGGGGGGAAGFADGGIVDRPTLAWVGEGKYIEAIVPLPDGRSIPAKIQGGGDNGRVVAELVSINERLREVESAVLNGSSHVGAQVDKNTKQLRRGQRSVSKERVAA